MSTFSIGEQVKCDNREGVILGFHSADPELFKVWFDDFDDWKYMLESELVSIDALRAERDALAAGGGMVNATDALSFIVGTMAQGYNQLGFIPAPKVEEYYIGRGFYVLQSNRRGIAVGYVLHGKPLAGKVLSIAQAIIDIDRRNLGFGELAVAQVVERAKFANCRAVKLRCADGLEANGFWRQMGFTLTKSEFPGNKRQRAINTYVLDLWPLLWDTVRPIGSIMASLESEGYTQDEIAAAIDNRNEER